MNTTTPPTLPHLLDLLNVALVVGMPSVQCPDTARILAGNSSRSYLVDKLMGRSQIGGCFAGVRMPRNLPPLPATELATIVSWINAGSQ